MKWNRIKSKSKSELFECALLFPSKKSLFCNIYANSCCCFVMPLLSAVTHLLEVDVHRTAFYVHLHACFPPILSAPAITLIFLFYHFWYPLYYTTLHPPNLISFIYFTSLLTFRNAAAMLDEKHPAARYG